MLPLALDGFVDALSQSRILEADQWDAVVKELLPRYSESKALAKELVCKGWLTRFQANKLLKGAAGELLLGPYILLDQLGEGGMGAVYKARHPAMKRTVALKVLRPGPMGESILRRFQQKIDLFAALSHPHLVAAHDAGRAGYVFYFAMEHLIGITLREVVDQEEPLPVTTVCQYISQAALGLQHAHEKGLVHRDIKPTNLFLTDGSDGTVKILDLGLARLRTDGEAEDDGAAQRGAIVGTPDYLAPEEVVNAADVDIRADIYSLGCVLYYLLAGQTPFPKGTLSEKLDKQLNAEPVPIRELRPEVTTALETVLGKMMAKRPEDRYRTPLEVADALASLDRETPPPAPVVPDDTIVPRHSQSLSDMPTVARSHRRIRWVLVVLLLGLLAVSPSIWWLGNTLVSKLEQPAADLADEMPKQETRAPFEVPFELRWLDTLDAKNIPAAARFDGQPNGLVGVMPERPNKNTYKAGSVSFLTTPPSTTVTNQSEKRLASFTESPRRVAVRDRKSGSVVWQWEVPAHFDVRRVGMSPDGRYLIIANTKETLYIVRLPLDDAAP